MPGLQANADAPWRDIVIHEHFYLGGSDWYMAEYSPSDRIFFGFVILNDDYLNAEWGNVGYDELRHVNVAGIEVDRDLFWHPRRASQVDRIIEAHRQQGRSTE